MFLLHYENLVDPVLRGLRTCMAASCGIRPGQSVLDVCCGTGAQVIEYHRHGIRATGIDLDRNMLGRAAGRFLRRNSCSPYIALADATCLPFTDASFDHVSISMALHDKLPQVRHRVIEEMKRVVRNQGYLLFADFQVPLPGFLRRMGIKTIERMAGGDHWRGFQEYQSAGGIDAALEGHGLVVRQRSLHLAGLILVIRAEQAA